MTTSSASSGGVQVLASPGARARWVDLGAPDASLVQGLVARHRLSSVLARLLALRGYGDPEAADRFLNGRLDGMHDPSLLPGMAAAVSTLMDARGKGEMIGIHGDYDVDGVTSVAFLTRSLRRLGFSVISEVPHRDDNYGLSARVLEAWAEKGVRTVLTCDVGVSNAAVVEDFGRRHGMRFVITDHHRPPANLPDAAAVVDPLIPGSEYPFTGLCGVGVSLKLVMALCREMKIHSQTVVGDLLDLVAIGTIADVVSLTDENRPIVKAGLQRLRETTNPGLQAMLEVTRIPPAQIDATAVGFRLAPQINAAGRIGDPNIALNLLLAEDFETALPLAREVFRLNEERKEIQAGVADQADSEVKRLIEAGAVGLAVFGPGPEAKPNARWHHGVIGIVAGRIKESTGCPVLVFTWDGERWKASGRAETLEGFDLYNALAACAPMLEKFGGHTAAAGATLHPDVAPADFAKAFDQAVRAQIGDVRPGPPLVVDVTAEASELTVESVEALAQAAPFGKDNPQPRVLLRGVTVDTSLGHKALHRMGKEGQFLKARLLQNGVPIESVVFQDADRIQALMAEGPVDIVAEVEINEWNRERKVQARLLDACRASGTASEKRAPSPRELFRG